MSKLKVSAIHDPDNDNQALSIDSSGNATFAQNLSITGSLTGDGSALTGIEGLPDAIDVHASAPADSITIDSNGNLSFNNGFGSTGTAFGVRAWVNFDGTSTAAIRKSGNISSLTDNGTGNYVINFSGSMPDTKYAAVASGGTTGSNGYYFAYCWNFGQNSVAVGTGWTSGNLDLNEIDVIIAR